MLRSRLAHSFRQASLFLKTVHFSQHIMSANKYASIFSPQTGTDVHRVVLLNPRNRYWKCTCHDFVIITIIIIIIITIIITIIIIIIFIIIIIIFIIIIVKMTSRDVIKFSNLKPKSHIRLYPHQA